MCRWLNVSFLYLKEPSILVNQNQLILKYWWDLNSSWDGWAFNYRQIVRGMVCSCAMTFIRELNIDYKIYEANYLYFTNKEALHKQMMWFPKVSSKLIWYKQEHSIGLLGPTFYTGFYFLSYTFLKHSSAPFRNWAKIFNNTNAGNSGLGFINKRKQKVSSGQIQT